MKYYMSLSIIIFSLHVNAGELISPYEIDISKYQKLFYEFVDKGKYVIYGQPLKREDVIFKSVSFKHSANCNIATTSFEAKLTRAIEADGELAGLGAVAVMVNIIHKSNGNIEVFPVLGSAEMIADLTSGSTPTEPVTDSLTCAR